MLKSCLNHSAAKCSSCSRRGGQMTLAPMLNYSARLDGITSTFPQASKRARRLKPLPPDPDNILSALAENQRRVKSQVSADQRAIALAWLLHLVVTFAQLLHTVQLFSREYPHGDRGGNEACVRFTPGGHRLTFKALGWTDYVDQQRRPVRILQPNCLASSPELD